MEKTEQYIAKVQNRFIVTFLDGLELEPWRTKDLKINYDYDNTAKIGKVTFYITFYELEEYEPILNPILLGKKVIFTLEYLNEMGEVEQKTKYIGYITELSQEMAYESKEKLCTKLKINCLTN